MNSFHRSNIRGILFDLGSTLIEYENIPWEELNLRCLDSGYNFLRQKGYVVPDQGQFIEEYQKVRQIYREKAAVSLEEWVITDAVGDLLRKIGLPNDNNLSDEFFAAYYEPVAAQLTIFDDTISVLNELRRRNYKMGLVSNTIFPTDYHLRDLKRFGVCELLDFTIFSSAWGYRKPHPNIYAEAVRLIALPKESLLFVGDRYLEDYLGPRQFGLDAVIKFRSGRAYPESFPRGVTVVKHLTELLNILQD